MRFPSNFRMNQIFFCRICRRRTTFFECKDNYVRAADSCVDSAERKLTKMTNQTVAAALDFVCVRNSDNFAQFRDQNGVKCIEERMEQFFGCYMSIMDKYLIAALAESGPRAQSEAEACM